MNTHKGLCVLQLLVLLCWLWEPATQEWKGCWRFGFVRTQATSLSLLGVVKRKRRFPSCFQNRRLCWMTESLAANPACFRSFLLDGVSHGTIQKVLECHQRIIQTYHWDGAELTGIVESTNGHIPTIPHRIGASGFQWTDGVLGLHKIPSTTTTTTTTTWWWQIQEKEQQKN